MSRWFRVYDDVLNDPKAQKLPDAAFRGWINLMCLASKHDGSLEQPVEDIAFALRKTVAKTRALLQGLESFGLLDRTETGWRPHKWDERQYKSDVSTARVKRFRQQGNAVLETPPESETEPESEAESEQIRSEDHSSAPPFDPPGADPDANILDFSKGRKTYTAEFEAFWHDYPTDALMSKSKAFEKWRRLGAGDRGAAMAAVPAFRAYCAKDTTYRPVHAERFLSQRRFDGFVAQQAQMAAQASAHAASGADDALRRAWGGSAAPLVEAIGPAKFAAWFAASDFDAGPPVTITVAKSFAAKWIREHYAGDLRRLYGEFRIEVRE